MLKQFDDRAIIAPQYFGTVEYYALYAAFGKVCVDIEMKADKRFKSAHRCTIVDTRDEIKLTVPVSHPHGHHSWNETPVSTHGHWWHVHHTALESAYGRTPFFEFYIDRFNKIFDCNIYSDSQTSVGELDIMCDKVVREILGLDNEVIYGRCNDTAYDLRAFDTSVIQSVEYYQIRASRLGFKAGMSILDLIFNMGTEAPLILRELEHRNHAQLLEYLAGCHLTAADNL